MCEQFYPGQRVVGGRVFFVDDKHVMVLGPTGRITAMAHRRVEPVLVEDGAERFGQLDAQRPKRRTRRKLAVEKTCLRPAA